MSANEQNASLSPIDWMMPRSYITQILCFSTINPQVPCILKDGLAGTLADVPYLTCEVVEANSPKGSVMLSKTTQSLDDLFDIKDISPTADYDTLKLANFSPSSLDRLDTSHADLKISGVGPQPVFRATLSLIRNGYLLCVSVHHSTTDITGFGALLKIWASHCRTGSSKSIQFADDWLDRGRLLPTPTNPLGRCPEYLHIREGSPRRKNLEDPGDAMESVIFNFHKQRLQSLKADVIRYLSGEMTWVSTSDILTAVLWSALSFAELQGDAHFAGSGTFSKHDDRSIRIPVNFRSRYRPSLPKNYLGAAFGISLATAKKIDLENIAIGADGNLFLSALARVAASVRKAVNLINEQNMRSVVEYLAAQSDLRGIELGPHSTSPSIVSWADQGIYDLDWGCKIGDCDAVRLPGLKNKRWPIVLPRHQNGDLEVFVRLPKRQIDILENVWVLRLLQATQLK